MIIHSSNPQPEPAPDAQRFYLSTLIEVIAGIAVLLALVTQVGVFGFVLGLTAVGVIAGADLVLFARRRHGAWLNVLEVTIVCLATLVLFLVLFGPRFPHASESSIRSHCANNLKQIAMAIHAYHADHGHLPPPYVADAQGNPMHSWRVLILPYLKRNDLYAAYNFNEPWNGPGNSKLATRIPYVFHFPYRQQPGVTNYFFIVGPGRSKPGAKHLTLSDIRDGPSNTILVVESSSAPVNWMEPRDLTVAGMLAGKNTQESPSASSFHRSETILMRAPSIVNYARADASVGQLPADIDREVLTAWLTIAAGDDSEPTEAMVWRWKWETIWLTGITVLFVIMAVLRRARLAARLRRAATQRATS